MEPTVRKPPDPALITVARVPSDDRSMLAFELAVAGLALLAPLIMSLAR